MKLSAISARAMRPDDIDAVLDIQSKCYDDSKLESAESFLSKLDGSPGTSFIALREGRAVGYLVAVLADATRPMPLNAQRYVRPATVDALYLHDLAVDPAARGAGVPAVLMAPYLMKLRELGLSCGTLTAVNDSGAFWQRHGFRDVAPAGPGAASLAGYGKGARFMRLDLEPAP